MALVFEVVCNQLMIRVFLLAVKTWANGTCVSAFVNSTVERGFWAEKGIREKDCPCLMWNFTHLAGFHLWSQSIHCRNKDFSQLLSIGTAQVPFPNLLLVSLMLQCVNKYGKIWTAVMVQLCEMLNAISLQHRRSQEMVGNNSPQSLGCSVLSCTTGCASVVWINSCKELCFWTTAKQSRLWILGYIKSFWFPVVVQLLEVWVHPYVLVTMGVDASSVFMERFNSCKIG